MLTSASHPDANSSSATSTAKGAPTVPAMTPNSAPPAFHLLDWPRSVATVSDGCAPGFVQGSVENLPFEDCSFDVVISNGALNLAMDKDSAFGEIARVLGPGGEMVVADLIVRETIPEELLASMDAWST
jgi:SAM-dependent methyltransferase